MSTSNIDNPTAEDIQSLAEQGLTLPLTYHTLKHYLPHRYPFLLVDKIVSCTPNECITGIKNVTINEEFFNGHFPEEPIMPGVLMIEAMAQVAGVLGFISKNVKPRDGYIYLFAGVDKVRFKRQVIPGDQLILRAQKTMERHSIYKFSCTACVGDELAASAEITIAEQRTQYPTK